MKTAFFVVLLIVAVFSALDIIFGDSVPKEDTSVIGTFGIKPIRRRPDVVAIFLISVLAMSVVLIVDLFSCAGTA